MKTIASILTDNLDIWTGAIERKSSAGRGQSKKFSLYGIEKLRVLILDLAVRGKLVPQNPKEQVDADLLRAVRSRNLKGNARSASLDNSAHKLFQSPENWMRALFGSVFSLEYGTNLPEKARSQTGEYPVFGSNGVVGSHHIASVQAPCIVVGRKGSAGAINLCLHDGCWVTDVAYYCIPPRGLDIRFISILFKTLRLDDLGKGIKPALIETKLTYSMLRYLRSWNNAASSPRSMS
jgi:type I restriction enzyme, S subunit